MFILPRNPEPECMPPVIHSLWKPRLYPGTLDTTARVRADLRHDLTSTSASPDESHGLDPDLVDSIVLCTSEMFANACEHTRSGEQDGRVIRTLTLPEQRTLRLSVIDDGYRDTDTRPRIPRQRTERDWHEAERGRGLLLIHHLAACWGTRRVVGFPFCEGLGTVLWADFDLPSDPGTLSAASAASATASTASAASAPEDVR
ncbi:ATP-binding protein [Nocardiopsis sp. HUAS JQ3]|uniref:ATP-binding protein n=1 Tax=Nocardiopsis sp. HUAS JQ3 TaxID=3061629 RepID=UPI0023A9D806|nr:ATP-binding protein [Nocardiopsis sp. HUAS JQ3]WDZ90699.1 ATP-binding protein [Nocardiopsis sp. HUAS JQ3]